jgi:hypothetical protein
MLDVSIDRKIGDMIVVREVSVDRIFDIVAFATA